jgi:hypothetical protein
LRKKKLFEKNRTFLEYSEDPPVLCPHHRTTCRRLPRSGCTQLKNTQSWHASQVHEYFLEKVTNCKIVKGTWQCGGFSGVFAEIVSS